MPKESSIRSQHTAEQIHSIAIHLLRSLRREDERCGLHPARLSALSVIVFGGPLTLGSLAAAEQVRPPTMTRIVNALEARQFVTKNSDPNDARTILIAATAAGRKLLLEARAHRVRKLAKQIATLSPEEQAALQQAAVILRSVVNSL